MGAGASTVAHENARKYPQYAILGGDAKWDELKDDEDFVALEKIHDPYLAYGGKYAEAKHEEDFVYVDFEELPKFSADHKSVLSRILTTELFEKYKALKTGKGFTLSNAIQAGVVSPNLHVGIVAGDAEAYTVFKELYQAVLLDLYDYDAKEQHQEKNLDASQLKYPSQLHDTFKKNVKKVLSKN